VGEPGRLQVPYPAFGLFLPLSLPASFPLLFLPDTLTPPLLPLPTLSSPPQHLLLVLIDVIVLMVAGSNVPFHLLRESHSAPVISVSRREPVLRHPQMLERD
jgi:hypothetical protein